MPQRHSSFTELWTALAVRRIMQTGGCSYSFLKEHEKTWKLERFLTDHYMRRGYLEDQIDLRFMKEKRRLLRSDLVIEVEVALGQRVFKTSAHAFDKRIIKECAASKNWSKLLPEFAGSGGLCIATFLNGVIFEERLKRYETKIDGIKKELNATKKGYLHSRSYGKLERLKGRNQPPVEPLEDDAADVGRVDLLTSPGTILEGFEPASLPH